MKKLLQTNTKNTAEEYNLIYFNRQKKGVDEFDQRRWKKLLEYYKGGKLIDLGCLDSQIPHLAKQKHPRAEVWGLDRAAEAIKDMETRYPHIFWQVGDIYNTKFPIHYFDYTVLGEVLEHLDHPQKAIEEAKRITKKNGVIAISVPFDEAREPGAKDKERHLWSFTKKDLISLCEPYKQIKFEIMGSIFKPVYKYNFPNLLIWIKK